MPQAPSPNNSSVLLADRSGSGWPQFSYVANSLCYMLLQKYMYRVEEKSLYVLISRSQTGPDRNVLQPSTNYFFHLSIVYRCPLSEAAFTREIETKDYSYYLNCPSAKNSQSGRLGSRNNPWEQSLVSISLVRAAWELRSWDQMEVWNQSEDALLSQGDQLLLPHEMRGLGHAT